VCWTVVVYPHRLLFSIKAIIEKKRRKEKIFATATIVSVIPVRSTLYTFFYELTDESTIEIRVCAAPRFCFGILYLVIIYCALFSSRPRAGVQC
jgi:hypothetical protein